MKIFDCTTYFDEELLMDVRFNILNEKVEKFIVVESCYSHSGKKKELNFNIDNYCLLYTSPSPRDRTRSRMPSSA